MAIVFVHYCIFIGSISTITGLKQEAPHAPELLAYGSSDEDADDDTQDSYDYPYVPYHPKPAAVRHI